MTKKSTSKATKPTSEAQKAAGLPAVFSVSQTFEIPSKLGEKIYVLKAAKERDRIDLESRVTSAGFVPGQRERIMRLVLQILDDVDLPDFESEIEQVRDLIDRVNARAGGDSDEDNDVTPDEITKLDDFLANLSLVEHPLCRRVSQLQANMNAMYSYRMLLCARLCLVGWYDAEEIENDAGEKQVKKVDNAVYHEFGRVSEGVKEDEFETIAPVDRNAIISQSLSIVFFPGLMAKK